ncbi:hypothetical protein Fraau_0974 [Frateuria aurantia DSM 6220]|uniref:Uncharacterized protein n=1 Tax=Frateuria aurantia (strain ATCC 33424 / DSM 6220 / KCTC 2777 / LMG 1558 / NBRC 3245 / NCIMB 13370) TaxID=767434 RepID=H8L2H1_FRAAD|nr:hypothetical protein Fraau_0974 [Frateuria aurantia DSM 6220]
MKLDGHRSKDGAEPSVSTHEVNAGGRYARSSHPVLGGILNVCLKMRSNHSVLIEIVQVACDFASRVVLDGLTKVLLLRVCLKQLFKNLALMVSRKSFHGLHLPVNTND